MIILEKEFYEDQLMDIEESIFDAVNNCKNITRDYSEWATGKFIVQVTYVEDEVK